MWLLSTDRAKVRSTTDSDPEERQQRLRDPFARLGQARADVPRSSRASVAMCQDRQDDPAPPDFASRKFRQGCELAKLRWV